MAYRLSPKRGKAIEHGRPIIGKFGIGKLATYVLAKKLTYICKASDGRIRRVTMDYGEIDRQMTEHPTGEKLIQDMQLDVFEVTEEEVRAALASVYGGDELFALIKNAASAPSDLPTEDEYGSIKTALQRDGVQTWTLVVLSGLKQPGQELKIGILKRMLAAALPFGSEMAITVNDTVLASSKLDVQRLAEWVIGPSLGIGCVNLIWPTLMLSFGPPLVDRFPAPVAAEPSDARRAARFGRSVDRGWKSKA